MSLSAQCRRRREAGGSPSELARFYGIAARSPPHSVVTVLPSTVHVSTKRSSAPANRPNRNNVGSRETRPEPKALLLTGTSSRGPVSFHFVVFETGRRGKRRACPCPYASASLSLSPISR